MGIIWILLMVVSIGIMMFSDPAGVLSAMTASVNESLLLCVKMCGVYCVWLGFIKIMEDINALKAVGILLRPLIEKLFGQVNPKAKDYLVVNISANLIGVANAATPTAIKAIGEMDRGDVKMTRGMAMLFVINATGIELLPSTVMSMRAAAGSASPADILLPSFIVNVVTTAIGILLVCLLYKKELDKSASEKSDTYNVSSPLSDRRA
ncbi:MAG: hypothetical protein HPY94_04110 [Clostridia bacterium]|nr:hypothetical protein [Clostridia bacterium]